MADQPKTLKLMGTGGAVWEFEVPLSPVIQKQLEKGDLKPVADRAKKD